MYATVIVSSIHWTSHFFTRYQKQTAMYNWSPCTSGGNFQSHLPEKDCEGLEDGEGHLPGLLLTHVAVPLHYMLCFRVYTVLAQSLATPPPIKVTFSELCSANYWESH